MTYIDPIFLWLVTSYVMGVFLIRHLYEGAENTRELALGAFFTYVISPLLVPIFIVVVIFSYLGQFLIPKK